MQARVLPFFFCHNLLVWIALSAALGDKGSRLVAEPLPSALPVARGGEQREEALKLVGWKASYPRISHFGA